MYEIKPFVLKSLVISLYGITFLFFSCFETWIQDKNYFIEFYNKKIISNPQIWKTARSSN